MKISKFIFEVKNKLAQGELKQGLDMLISTIEYDDSTTQNSLIVISASFEELKKEKNRGVVRDTDYSLRYNKILVQILEIIDDVTKDYNIPIIYNFPAGHLANNHALILGKQVAIEVTDLESKVVFE